MTVFFVYTYLNFIGRAFNYQNWRAIRSALLM